MGNHEFCEECGASDFHYGQPCNPERKAAYQAERKKIEDRNKRAKAVAKETVSKLKKLGYKAEIDQYGDISINRFSLLKE